LPKAMGKGIIHSQLLNNSIGDLPTSR
jgi:hypothetical protein